MGRNTKERILEEALKLFAQYGYGATSMNDIAAKLGISKAALYKHYKGKQEILDSIVERMNQKDIERMKEYEMPEGSMEELVEAYKLTPLEKIKQFTLVQFLHWTEDAFSSSFRRMLTLEQYRVPEMSNLYQHYLAEGPIAYMQQIFAGMTEHSQDAEQLALDFYGPIYFLYGVYDRATDKQKVVDLVKQHVERFSKEL